MKLNGEDESRAAHSGSSFAMARLSDRAILRCLMSRKHSRDFAHIDIEGMTLERTRREGGTLRPPEQRFEELYRTFRDPVFAYAMRRSSPDVAQDVVAETFAIAWRRFDSVPLRAPELWLFATARKVLASRRRRELRQEQIANRLGSEVGQVSREVNAGAPPILAALATLSEPDREVLLLSAWEGLSSEQGAAVLGCSRTAFRLRLHRARRRLREQMVRAEAAPERPQLNAAQVKEIL
jgi:RNA polymerase sigma-70 factor, ECF subfamily